MKKKIINGIMMVALVAATSTSFVSCKDTNEDVRIEQAAEIAALQGRLTDLENKYGDLDGRVTALRTELRDTEDRVDLIEKRCDELEEWLQEAFTKLVTSIEINGTWNNMTGMVALPGVKANMLIANYGTAGKGGKFPVEGKLVDEDEEMSWDAGDKFGYSEDYATYAGTIYATVNKFFNYENLYDAADFGAQLVTTSGRNIDDYVTIAVGNEGKPTEKELTWGWTRADNNVYEFNIGIKGDPEELGFNILKIEGLKDDLKTIWNKRQSTSASEFASAVAKLYYTAIQGGAGSNLPMYALRLGWTTGDADSQTITSGSHSWTQPQFMNNAKHFVQSDADLMLATIKPFAFTTKDVPTAITPKVQMTLDQAENIFNKLMASLNSIISRVAYRIKGGADYADNYTLQNMMMKTIVGEANNNNHITDRTIANTVEANAIYYVDAPIPYYIYTLGTTINAYTLPPRPEDYFGDQAIMLSPYFAEYLSTGVDQINRAISMVQDALQYANNGNLWKDKVEDRILNYAAKADSWLSQNFNNGLQPTLFAIHGLKQGTKILQTIDTTNAKLNRVSGVKAAPLYVKGGEPVILKPTSYTLETFAPIMAKFVTITEIDGKAITPAEAEALSIDVNKGAKLGHVIDSYFDQYAFVPEAGKKYTVLYEAVDYFGNTTSKYYFIQGE
jgi:hypothetical protein